MSITTNETVEILNDLIQINNDRIVGYEKALKELKTEDEFLKPSFLEFIDQSRTIKNELGNEVQVLGGTIDSSTTTSGKIYRAWMDSKAVFTGNDVHEILANCEYGEDAAQKAYENALDEKSLPQYIRTIILKEQMILMSAHNKMKSYRDQLA